MNEFGKLQLALDMTDLNEANAIATVVSGSIDIIEAGTPLCLQNGLQAVRRIRESCPNSFLTADIRIARAGAKLADMAFDSGADSVTVVGEAPFETVRAASEVAAKHGKSIQMEPHSETERSTMEKWLQLGITHVIWHNASEPESSGSVWSKKNLEYVNQLTEIGFKVSVTGGITLESIGQFTGVPVHAFIVGRAIAGSTDPVARIGEFKSAIEKLHA